MQQSLAHSHTGALDRTGLAPSGEELKAAEPRHFAMIHEMEEPEVPASERRVPMVVSLSVLLLASLALWAGLIWVVTAIF